MKKRMLVDFDKMDHKEMKAAAGELVSARTGLAMPVKEWIETVTLAALERWRVRNAKKVDLFSQEKKPRKTVKK